MTPEELEEILSILNATPEQIKEITKDLGRDCLTWKASPKHFSILENVCHLRDIEREGYTVRIERIVAEETPVLPDINGPQLALERKYNEENLEPALASFVDARSKTIALIKELSEDQFSRIGTFEDQGDMTLAGMLAVMCEHDQEHLRDIKEARDGFYRSR
ncbi:MAG TPA: DinB family protein [Blastocatellia bacterium]|nr:DinB family protein [Blastocatellia bacterium]